MSHGSSNDAVIFPKREKKKKVIDGGNGGDGGDGRPERSNRHCTSCDMDGHTSSRCRNMCFMCKQEHTGHLPRDCEQRCLCDDESKWHLIANCRTRCRACHTNGHKAVNCSELCEDEACESRKRRPLHTTTWCTTDLRRRAEKKLADVAFDKYTVSVSLENISWIPELYCGVCQTNAHTKLSCPVDEYQRSIEALIPSHGRRRKLLSGVQ